MRIVAVLFPILALSADTYVIFQLSVVGHSRLSEAAIRAELGFRAGQTVSRNDFELATARLLDTGMFSSVKYRYLPKRDGEAMGVELTFMVTEQPASLPVVIDIAGFDEGVIWQWIRQHDALLDKKLPANSQALARCAAAVERFLHSHGQAGPLKQETEADLDTRETTIIFRLANRPVIKEIRFTGNKAIPEKHLQGALPAWVTESEYSERTLRRLLDFNLRPLYEEKGRLGVRFHSLAAARHPAKEGVTVTVAVEEGPAYLLGQVDVSGQVVAADQLLSIARFPVGRLANWKEVSAGLARIRQSLRREGYLEADIQTDRNLDEQNRVARLNVKVHKGQQFSFGRLELEGLSPEAARYVRSRWRLREGAAMNEPYIGEFLNEVAPNLSGLQSVSPQLRVRPQTNIVDVIIIFR